MMRRFSQLLLRPFARQSVEEVEGVGSASRETSHDVRSRQVKVNKTSGDRPGTDSVTDAVGEYAVTSFDYESSIHSKYAINANRPADRWATTYSSDTESQNGNDDAKFDAVVDKRPNTDLLLANATGQVIVGMVEVDSIGGERSDQLDPANLDRWSSVDHAYDADIDEMPCADVKMTGLREKFSYAVNGVHVPGLNSDTDYTDYGEEEPSVDVAGAYVVGAGVVGTNVVGANVVGADVVGVDVGADVVGVDVGAGVVGADVVGASVVGADVVGDEPREFFDVPISDEEESSVHSNVNNANPDRWETPYNSDTDPWSDDSDDGTGANVDPDSNAIGQKDVATAEVTSVGLEPRNQLDSANLGGFPIVDFEYDAGLDAMPRADGKMTGFSEGISDAIHGGHVPGLKADADDVDAVGENPGFDEISHESDLTSVSQVSADEYSVNDDWGPAFISDHEPWKDFNEELGRHESTANVVSLGEQPSDQSYVVGVSEKPFVQSNVFSFGKQPSDQPRTATHTYTTVFISDHESDEESAADDSKTSAAKDHPDECSHSTANVDAEENLDPVENIDESSTIVKETSAVDVNPEKKVEREGVSVGAVLNITPTTSTADWALPVIDEVTWVKSGEDFDWDDADSDTDWKPPFRLLCGCFPRRRRRLSIQLRRYRVKKGKKEEVHAEKETKDTNFVEIKCPKGPSYRRFFRSH